MKQFLCVYESVRCYFTQDYPYSLVVVAVAVAAAATISKINWRRQTKNLVMRDIGDFIDTDNDIDIVEARSRAALVSK